MINAGDNTRTKGSCLPHPCKATVTLCWAQPLVLLIRLGCACSVSSPGQWSSELGHSTYSVFSLDAMDTLALLICSQHLFYDHLLAFLPLGSVDTEPLYRSRTDIAATLVCSRGRRCSNSRCSYQSLASAAMAGRVAFRQGTS